MLHMPAFLTQTALCLAVRPSGTNLGNTGFAGLPTRLSQDSLGCTNYIPVLQGHLARSQHHSQG